MNHRKHRRRIGIVLAVLFLMNTVLVPLSGCASGNGKPVVLQLRWQHQFQFAGYYAALWNGYFKEEGLDVEIRSGFQPDGSVLNAVEEVDAGRADFGVGAADILLARDQGKDLRLVASFFQRSAVEFYTRGDTPARALAELARMKLFRRQGDLLDIELQAMMAAEGIRLGSDGLLPANREVTAEDLLSGTYDLVPGYLGTIPYYAAQEGKVLRTLQPINYGIDFYGDSLFVSGRTANSDPEMVERFRKAAVRGWSYALEHPEEMAARIAKEFPQNGKTEGELKAYNRNQAEQVRKLTYYPVVEVGNINGFRWQEMGRILKTLGLVKGEPSGGELIFDYQLLQQQRTERFQRRLILGFGAFLALLTVVWVILLNVKNRQLAREVREKNKAQAELIRSNQRYESIFNNTVVGITLTDRSGRLIQTNDRWNELTGYGPGELIGTPIYDLMVPEERDKARVESVAGIFDEGYVTERLYQRKDGSTFWGRLYINSILDLSSDDKVNLGITVDITSERVEQEALQRSDARFRELVREIAGRYDLGAEPMESERHELAFKLEKINLELEKLFKSEMDENRRKEALLIHQARQAAMGEMVASIAHQWRQPLNSLSLVLGNLEDGWAYGELDDASFSRNIQKCRQLISRMSETIDSFRDFLKPDRAMEPFSLNRTVQGVLELMEDSMRTGGIRVTVDAAEEYMVFGYPSQFSQTLFNLLTNAMDALSEVEYGGRNIRISVATEDAYGADRVVLRICDSGGGIAPEVLERVFEPYVTTKDSTQGTGLGLYISRLIVENTMKGSLTLENREDGVCATVVLPLGGGITEDGTGGDERA